MRPKIILASLTSLSLSIVSTTFVLLALTSNRWSIQKYYETLVDGGSPIAWTDPVCVAHRSPFYRCGIPSVSFNATTNVTTCEIPDCAFYAPSGWNQTSCRLPVETGTEDNSLNGGAQECQEGTSFLSWEEEVVLIKIVVHYAGHLQIAASCFLCLGLLLLLPLTVLNVVIGTFSGESTRERGSEPVGEAKAERHASAKLRHRSDSYRDRLSPWTPYVVLLLVTSLYAGAFLQILAQLFGILGLTVNATPTPAEATQNGSEEFGASTWIMDKALTEFATVAWATALPCALLTGYIYRTPKFSKLV